MKPVLILESSASALSINESAAASGDSKKKYVLNGIFTEFDITNRNNRIYTAEEFIPCLEAMMGKSNWGGAVYGELDHPDVFDVSMKHVSHLVEKATFNAEKNRVDGEIRLLSTTFGKEARAIVDDGAPLFVSSRASGITEANNYVKIRELFTYDIVADPGFTSAKMNIKNINESAINESVGIGDDTNTRVLQVPKNRVRHLFDLTDTSKTNELFEMNKKDYVTKKQLSDYSRYLTKEIETVQKKLVTKIQESKKQEVDPEMGKYVEYFENLRETQDSIVKYLDYLADKVTFSINASEANEKKTNKLVKYTNYLAEALDKNINYSEYIAENLGKSIEYAEYLAENLSKNIEYSEYLAENLDKNISYSEYLAENLTDSIQYSEYLAEQVEKGISYTEYIAENLDATIGYTEHLAENLETSIAYGDYLGETMETAIQYSEYMGECIDNTMSYASMIAEKLNTNKTGNLNESIQTAEEFLEEGLGKFLKKTVKKAGAVAKKVAKVAAPVAALAGGSKVGNIAKKVAGATPAGLAANALKKKKKPAVAAAAPAAVKESLAYLNDATSTESIGSKIDKLITEAKKREASKDKAPAFYAFLTPEDIKSFEALSVEDREKSQVRINESVGFYTRHDVLSLIHQALEVEAPTKEQVVLANIPSDVKKLWESASTAEKKAILGQANLYNLGNADLIENFWHTRKFTQPVNENRRLVDFSNPLERTETLSDAEMDAVLNRFKGLK